MKKKRIYKVWMFPCVKDPLAFDEEWSGFIPCYKEGISKIKNNLHDGCSHEKRCKPVKVRITIEKI